jgi:hypothetical protein
MTQERARSKGQGAEPGGRAKRDKRMLLRGCEGGKSLYAGGRRGRPALSFGTGWPFLRARDRC